MNTKVVVFLLLFSLIPAAGCCDEPDKCRSLLFRPAKAFKGTRLKNHVISVTDVIVEDFCMALCYMEPNCVSYNFKTAAGENGNHECELNNSTHEGHETDLEKDSNYKHQGAESACVSSPCTNNRTCQAGFTDQGYRCLCTARFRGHNCETSERQIATWPASDHPVMPPSIPIVSPTTSVSAGVSSPVSQADSTITSVSTSITLADSHNVPHLASLPASLSSAFIQTASYSKSLYADSVSLPIHQTSSPFTSVLISHVASSSVRPRAVRPTSVSASPMATQLTYVSAFVSQSFSESKSRSAIVSTSVLELVSSTVCKHVSLSAVVSPGSSQTKVLPFTATFTADNEMEMFADGISLGGDNGNWKIPDSFPVPRDTRVISVAGKDAGGGWFGILGSFSNGLVTNESWKCSGVLSIGWNSPDFDDQQWPFAVVTGNHGDHPWGNIPGIVSNAKWIWASGQYKANVYCRLNRQ